MGSSASTGWRVNLEYTYINQDELRIGTRAASPAEGVDNPSNPASRGAEIERNTIDRFAR